MGARYLGRTAAVCVAGLVLTATGLGSPGTGPANDPGKLVVHEWGTFLAVQGSDGVSVGGMVASEEPLPSFVVSRGVSSWTRTLWVSKMETPVTYFYTDKPRSVSVRVDMPQGVLTHWFPMVRQYGPPVSDKPMPNPPGSFIFWNKIDLIPPTAGPNTPAGTPTPVMWRVQGTDPWRHARVTDSAFVKTYARDDASETGFDYEKFLFYRGLGSFPTPLAAQTTASSDGLHLAMTNRTAQPLTGVFAVKVENETIAFARLPDVPGAEAASSHRPTVSLTEALSHPLSLNEGVHPAKEAVAKALMAAGLYEKEAWAMVNTWDRSYFRTDGLRLLYLLPRETTDALIPIQIKPTPDQLVRVMVGRTELLTPETERRIEQWVGELGATDYRLRQTATAGLAKLGRITEPALRRVMSVTKDPEVRTRAESLIRDAAAKD
jgi:hypothetical protein